MVFSQDNVVRTAVCAYHVCPPVSSDALLQELQPVQRAARCDSGYTRALLGLRADVHVCLLGERKSGALLVVVHTD